jgi:hypothetical protein
MRQCRFRRFIFSVVVVVSDIVVQGNDNGNCRYPDRCGESAKVMLVLAQSLAHVLALPATEMYRPAGMDITHRAVVDATAAHTSSMEALRIWPVARIEARSN